MKIKCHGCKEEYEAKTPDDIYQHYIQSDEIIPNTKDYCILEFKIHEKIEWLKQYEHDNGNSWQECRFADKLLKSLLENEK